MTNSSPAYEPLSAKTVMNRVSTPKMPFDWSINPYRGCTHGCSFCYARETHTFMGKAADDSFRTQVFMKTNAAEALEAQLEKMAKRVGYNLTVLARQIGVVQIGTATDPYQPIEARTGITRKCLEVLKRFRVPVAITTRSPLVLRDIDVLQKMDIRGVHLSVHTLNKSVWRNLEPATPAPLKRLEAVAALVNHDIPAGILLAPVIPGISDSTEDLADVVQAAKAHHAQFLWPSALRLSPEVKIWFMGVIKEKYPREYPRLAQLYRDEYAPKWYEADLKRRVHLLMAQHGFEREDRMQLARSMSDECQEPTYLEGVSVQMSLPI
ncbi:MAG: radical SAM protein [Alicyclobacillus sp.]|nr:radical SAM protein [Alicyclobacillus sp.]